MWGLAAGLAPSKKNINLLSVLGSMHSPVHHVGEAYKSLAIITERKTAPVFPSRIGRVHAEFFGHTNRTEK